MSRKDTSAFKVLLPKVLLLPNKEPKEQIFKMQPNPVPINIPSPLLQSLTSWSFRTWTSTKLQVTNIKTIMSMHWSLSYPALWNHNNLYTEHHSVICRITSWSTSLLYQYHKSYITIWDYDQILFPGDLHSCQAL